MRKPQSNKELEQHQDHILRTVSSINWGGGGGGGKGIKAVLQSANFTLSPDATLNTEIHKKNRFAYTLPTQSMHQSENIKIKSLW